RDEQTARTARRTRGHRPGAVCGPLSCLGLRARHAPEFGAGGARRTARIRDMRGAVRPGARLLPALRAGARVTRQDPGATVVVLVADHILDADLQPVLGRHHDSNADLGLPCIPAAGAPPGACLLTVDASGAVCLIPDGSARGSTLA